MKIEGWGPFLWCWLGSITTLGHPLGSWCSWPGSQQVLFDYWSASDIARHNCGCVTIPQDVPCSWWWVTSFGGALSSRSQGRCSTPEYWASWEEAHSVVGRCPVGKEEDGQNRVQVPLVRLDRYSQVILNCFWYSASPRCPTAGARVWCILLTSRHSKTSCIRQNSKLQPWSLCSSHCTSKWQKTLITNASVIDNTSWLGMA
jgi:hypothetical protein